MRMWLAALLILASTGAARADAVTVRAEPMGGGARLSFEWPSAVRYTAQRIDNRLIITFARSFEGDLSKLAGSLPGGEALRTPAGNTIELLLAHPAHGALAQCQLALTTVGANTAELGALGVPMIVLVPTQHLHVMQAWDGWMGLLARLPLARRLLGVALTAWRMRHRGFLAWPNITAGRAVVPERVGPITPQQIAEEAADWLDHPDRLEGLRDDLRSLRGRPGAVAALAGLVRDLLPPGLTA